MAAANVTTALKNDRTGFLRAVRANNTKLVREYLEAGYLINKLEREKEDDPLYITITNNQTEMVRVLLEGNMSVNRYFEGDESILYYAISKGNVQIVSLLLKAGADPNIENNYTKDTPLMKAAEIQSVKIIQLLCEYNANPSFSAGGKTAMDFAKTKQVKAALAACVPERKVPISTDKILSSIKQSIETRGTFPIQSQKTGQCFSDSFQHVLYFADGISRYTIDRALEQKSKFTKRGNLPLESEEYRKRVRTPTDAVNLYLDYTGVRFLDMFSKTLLNVPLRKNRIAVRRPSLHSVFSNQPLGIVCSQSLDVYQTIFSIMEEHRLYSPGNNEPRVSTERNFPHTLDEEGMGYLSDTTTFNFFTTIFSHIPPSYGKFIIRGETNNPKFKFNLSTRTTNKYAADPKDIVGVLIGVYGGGGTIRTEEQPGHAISLLKHSRKWYVCDDNIGFALPIVGEFNIKDLFDGEFIMVRENSTQKYGIFNSLSFQIDDQASYIKSKKGVNPRDYFHVLAEYPLREVVPYEEMKESSYGQGGWMDINHSRKYIIWTPPVTNNTTRKNKPANNKRLNNTLRALGRQFGIFLNEGADPSNPLAAAGAGTGSSRNE